MRPLSLTSAFKHRCRQIAVQATHQIEKIVSQSGLGLSIPTEPKAVPELSLCLVYKAAPCRLWC
jgi:hypothetical protein